MKYMLDTNIFNRLLDGRVDISKLPDKYSFLATAIQLHELKATANSTRRAQLLEIFNQVAPEVVRTESFAFDVPGSGFGEAKWNSDNGQRVTSLKNALDSWKLKSNNLQDALIAEVALVNGFGLITADEGLSEIAQQHGIDVQYVP